MKIAVTGGAGFIGSHLVDALLAIGHSVTIVDDFSSGFAENLALASCANLIRGSILDEDTLRCAVRDCQVVFHLAAVPSVPRSIREPLLSHAVNSTGTLLVLEACRQAGIKRIIYAASSSAQGDLGDRPRNELIQGCPQSPYAVAKYSGELYGAVYHEVHHMDIISLRFFNVYGPRQRLRGAYSTVIPEFLAAGLSGRPAAVYGDGLQIRDFTFVGDVVKACILAMESVTASGMSINVSSGYSVSILELAEIVGRLLHSPLRLQLAPARDGDIRHIRSDPSRAERVLGFRAPTSLEEGLRRTAEWFRDYLHAETPALVCTQT